MQKTCVGDSYALSREEEMFSYLSETRVDVIKKPIMITLLPTRTLKNARQMRTKGSPPYLPQAILEKRAKESYYSILVPSEKDISPFITVVQNVRNDVLRITMVNMAIYECYLFALGLPANFPSEQIIIHGDDRVRYIPCRSCQYCEKLLFDYELTVPSGISIEAYQQQILNDLNEHFQLDVKVENLSVVKDSRRVFTTAGELVELIWEELPMLIIKAKVSGEKDQELN
ncbi:hypothetical protein [Sphingobacterium anhuiense]|uniref:Uncharacterized protein n=1 Tax=Sphingobacterium anhuiense TaxID=493780 RepID=A0ABW5YQ27_9SPHI